jgi:glycosyltransferase involved in cell wall biosynthesis
MNISVIIPTYNEGGVLEECLESLGAQTYPDFEIIVVDDGSTDKTSGVLRNLQLTISNFQFFRQNHLGAGAARNLGARHAKGEILIFVDADMTFDKDFLKKLVAPIIKGGVKGTFSKEEYVANWGSLWARCWNINEGWEPKRRHPRNYPDRQPVFRAILKSEFDRVGGFTPGGYNDDWSLSQKLGYEAMSAPGAIFYHKNPSSLNEIFNHARWVGKRDYKLGCLGYLGALARSSLPVALVIGLYKSLAIFNFKFLIFKLTYDFGISVGIVELLLTGKQAK